jgi:RNA polymerase sigma-70 factor (ECF subfamily)
MAQENKPGENTNPEASEEFARLYDELRSIARRLMKGERLEHTLQPTALVHEAWIRAVTTKKFAAVPYDNVAYWAARVMRNLLVDHARKKARAKRGGNAEREALELAFNIAAAELPRNEILDLDDALDRLGRQDPELAAIVEQVEFTGRTIAEAAEALRIPEAKAAEQYKAGRAWLDRELKQNRSRHRDEQ